MLPLLDGNADYTSFSENFNDNIFLYGIDDEIELDEYDVFGDQKDLSPR